MHEYRITFGYGPISIRFNLIGSTKQLKQISELVFCNRNRIRCFKQEGEENYEALKSKDIPDKQDRLSNEVQTNGEDGHNKTEIPFLAMIVIALGVAAIATFASIRQQPILGSPSGLQILSQGSSSSAVAPVAAGFTFKVFGFSVIIPQYAPGYT